MSLGRAFLLLGLLGTATAGQFLKKERELSVEEQLAQLRKENADMRASLESYRLAVENVSRNYAGMLDDHVRARFIPAAYAAAYTAYAAYSPLSPPRHFSFVL